MAHYRLSGPAEADLDDIWLYIAQHDPAAADRQLDAIVDSLLLITNHPLIGRSRNELGTGLRSLPVGNYLIIHRPIDDGVEIVRILHGARNVSALFDNA